MDAHRRISTRNFRYHPDHYSRKQEETLTPAQFQFGEDLVLGILWGFALFCIGVITGMLLAIRGNHRNNRRDH